MRAINVLKYTWNHPSNRDRRFRSISNAFAWQIWKRTINRPWTIPVFDSMKLRCYNKSNVAGIMIYTGGWPDFDEMHFVQRYLRPGDGFLDIGTNIGTYSLLAAKCIGPTGHIKAIEAGRLAYERYVENIQLNQLDDMVESRFAAVGAEPGTIRFLLTGDQGNRIATQTDAQADKYEDVDCITLDSFLEGQTFSMGKIDIEGAEPLAFQGAKQTLTSANPPVWLMELKARLLKKFDTTPEEVAKMLAGFGYQLGVYDGTSNSLTFPREPWIAHDNVLAIHQDHIDQTQARLHGEG